MPLTLEQARKNDYYQNVTDADERKQLKAIQEALARMQISGSSPDSTNPLRDDNNVLLSYEDPNEPGESIEEPFQYVRLKVRQKSTQVSDYLKYLGEDIIFKEIFPQKAVSEDITDETEINLLAEELVTAIEEQQELNSGLAGAINSLNAKIADDNDVEPADAVQAGETSERARKLIEKIQESLLENGQYRPLTVNKNNNQILTGNHTWLAMKELGWEKCTVTYVDVDENKAKKIVLVDNRLSDVADYDNELLSKMLQDMVEDLMGTGFEQKDVDELLAEYDGEVEIEVIDIPNPKPTGQPEAVKDVVLYLDEEQFKNYKTWIEAILKNYKRK